MIAQHTLPKWQEISEKIFCHVLSVFFLFLHPLFPVSLSPHIVWSEQQTLGVLCARIRSYVYFCASVSVIVSHFLSHFLSHFALNHLGCLQLVGFDRGVVVVGVAR